MGEVIRMHCRHCGQTYLTTSTDQCDLCRKTGGLVIPTSIQPSPDEAIQALATRVTERLQHGESPETIRAELISQGLTPGVADLFLADWMAKWGHLKPGGLLHILGVVVVLSGVVLALGNRTGAFPTFPFAGALVMLLGVGIMGIGIAGFGRRRGPHVKPIPPNEKL